MLRGNFGPETAEDARLWIFNTMQDMHKVTRKPSGPSESQREGVFVVRNHADLCRLLDCKRSRWARARP